MGSFEVRRALGLWECKTKQRLGVGKMFMWLFSGGEQEEHYVIIPV